MEKLIVASGNKGKIAEIKTLMGDRFEVLSMREYGVDVDVEETGSTFMENALIKARAIFEITRENVISDDSGLIVDALGGEPGIYSARYCGRHGFDGDNNELLLKNMTGKTNRTARYACACALITKDATYTGYGETEGLILTCPDGDGGFGYDPLFYSLELGKSFGRTDETEKNKISHRARALRQLLSALKINN